MTPVVVRAPAKLNLVLRVGARRGDGYHELVSAIQQIDLCDELSVEVDERDLTTIAVSAPGVTGGDTLVTRAIRLVLERAGIARLVRVHIDKRIPVAAGLGGGSSDAAAAMRAVNALLPGSHRLDPATLRSLAASVGADVPVFLTREEQIVTGTGTHTRVVDGIPRRRFLVVWPGAPCPTGQVFARRDPERTPPLPSWESVAADAREGRFANDLTEAAIETCPEIGPLLGGLSAAGLEPHLSGSGGSVFAEVADDADVGAIAGHVEAAGWADVHGGAG